MSMGTTVFDPANPVSVDDSSIMPSPANNVSARLLSALAADASTTIALSNISGSIPSSGWISIDNEIISYTGLSGSTLTGCVRGAQGTSVATHYALTLVNWNVTAQALQVLIDAVIRLERWIVNQAYVSGTTDGTGSINLSSTPITGKKILLFINGVVYLQNTDFTVSGNQILFSAGNPIAGLWWLALYVAQ